MSNVRERVLNRSNLSNTSAQKSGEKKVDELKEEFERIRARLLEGERYVDKHPDHEEAVRKFRNLLKRTAEINEKLIERGEEPLGRGEDGEGN